MLVRITAVSAVALVAAACGGGPGSVAVAAKRPTPLGEASAKGTGDERCDVTGPDREASEYDTSGDMVPDVRKVYLAVGTGMEQRMVVICRETDLNGDGRKDVIRYYDDEGRTVREEADRNFDGKMDLATQYQNGEIMREDFDANHDGKIELKVFYEKGEALRSERDIAGRSTPEAWRPDRWEYYEKGRIVRMGTDVDGDSKVDRWDRDATFERDEGPPEASAETTGAETTGASADTAAQPAPGTPSLPASGEAPPAGASTPAAAKSSSPAGPPKPAASATPSAPAPAQPGVPAPAKKTGGAGGGG